MTTDDRSRTPRLRKVATDRFGDRHYDVMDPLNPTRLIGHVRSYRATDTSQGNRHVERGWVATLQGGYEPEPYTGYATRREAVAAIIKAVYP